MNIHKVSVVIPSYNHYDLLHQVLFDLYNFCRESIDEVIVVNDGSTDVDVYTGLEWWKKQKMLPLRVLETEENVGFLKASNMGLRKASGDLVVLLSNDVRMAEDVIKKMWFMSEFSRRTLVGGRLFEVSTGWNDFDGKIFPYLEGWFLATHKSSWEELGYFDERYSPNDYEDIDLSTTALKLGYSLTSLESLSANMYHIGSQSIGYSPERERITQRNRKRFKEKWLSNK